MALSAAGTVLSLAILLATFLFSLPEFPGPFSCGVLLHVGVFVVWLPAVLMAQKLRFGSFVGRWTLSPWRGVFRGCPLWMKVAFWVLFYTCWAIAVLDFASTFFPQALGKWADRTSWRVFSAVWCMFYTGAFLIHYSARSCLRPPQRKCPFGHPVSATAERCEVCGAPVTEPPIAPPANGESGTPPPRAGQGE